MVLKNNYKFAFPGKELRAPLGNGNWGTYSFKKLPPSRATIPVKSQISPVSPTARSWSFQVWIRSVPQGSWLKGLTAHWGTFIERLDNEDWNLIGRLSYQCNDLMAARNCEGQEKKGGDRGGGWGKRTHAEATWCTHAGLPPFPPHILATMVCHEKPTAKKSASHRLTPWSDESEANNKQTKPNQSFLFLSIVFPCTMS